MRAGMWTRKNQRIPREVLYREPRRRRLRTFRVTNTTFRDLTRRLDGPELRRPVSGSLSMRAWV
jgi:hypothetical protein